MLMDIDHIGIAVKNLGSVMATLEEAFGIQPSFEENVSDQMVRVAGFNIGNSVIEYIEPTATDSPLSKFLDKRGNGLHHIAFRVADIDNTLDRLKSKGFQLIDDKAKNGAGGKRIAFLHPKSFNGILIELCEY
jgi:methylmalonyl-CoA epimerase